MDQNDVMEDAEHVENTVEMEKRKIIKKDRAERDANGVAGDPKKRHGKAYPTAGINTCKETKEQTQQQG